MTGTGSVVKEAGGLLAEVEVAREADFGVTDVTYTVMSHLGHILIAGKSDSRHLELFIIEAVIRFNGTMHSARTAVPQQMLPQQLTNAIL
jgi:hypothetical protein